MWQVKLSSFFRVGYMRNLYSTNMNIVNFISNLHYESLRHQGRKEQRWRKKEQLFPLALSQPAAQFLISLTMIWDCLVCLIFWGGRLQSQDYKQWQGSLSFHSTSDPVDSPGPAHCIESVATESPVMLVKNAYSWNPLHQLLTVLGGGLEPITITFLDDSKSHKSLRTMEDLHISGRATHLQRKPQELPEMLKGISIGLKV